MSCHLDAEHRWPGPSLEWHITAPSRNSDTVNGRPATGSERNKPGQFGIAAFMALLCLHREEWPPGLGQPGGGVGDKARL